MTPAEFAKEVAGPGRRPLYLVTGGEMAAVKRCLAAAEGAVAPGFRDFNYQTPEVAAGGAAVFLREALSGPFGAPPRVLVAQNPPFTADDWALLADYLADPNPDTTIILAVDKVDNRLKLAKEVKKAGAEVDCAPPKGAALTKWLVNEFAARGANCPAGVANLVIERLGEDLPALLGEAEKLSLYVGPGGAITPALVKDMVALSPSATVFMLGDALGQQNARGAITALLELLTTENHMPVLAMMVRHFRLMLQVKTLQALYRTDRLSPDQARDLGLHPFVLGKTQAQAARWGWPALKEALRLLEEAHRAAVTTATPPRYLLEDLALRLSGLLRAGRP